MVMPRRIRSGWAPVSAEYEPFPISYRRAGVLGVTMPLARGSLLPRGVFPKAESPLPIYAGKGARIELTMPPGWKNTGSVDELVRNHREARLRLKTLFDEISALGEWLTDIGSQLAEKPWDLDESELRQLAGIADLVTEYKQALTEFEEVDEQYRAAWGERS
jgi:hypothetical protein